VGARRFLRWLKPAGYILGIFLLLFLAVIVMIRSPFVMSRILPPIQAKIERDFNLKTKITSLSIDPFARLELQGIDAEFQKSGLGKAKLNIESVLVRFSFWELLKKKLVVTEIDVVRPSVEADFVLPKSAETKDPPSNPLPLLRQLVTHPPASVNLSSVDVRNLKLNVRLRQGEMQTFVRLQDLSLSSELNLADAALSAGINVRIPVSENGGKSSSAALIAELKGLSPEIPSIYFEANPELTFATKLQLSFRDPAMPFLQLSESNVIVSGERIQLTSKLKKAGLAEIKLQKFKLDNRLPAEILIDLATVFDLEKASGEEFERRIVTKVLETVKTFSLSGGTELVAGQLEAQIRLPAEGIDAAAVLDAAVPLKFNISPKEYSLLTDSKPFVLNLRKINLKGSAFKAIVASLKPELLNGLKIDVPLRLRLAAPTLADLKKPLTGIRLSELKISPRITWGTPSELLLSADLNASQSSSGVLTLGIKNDLNIGAQLMNFVPALKAVQESLGYLQVSTGLDSVVSTRWSDLQAASDKPSAGLQKIGVKYDVKINQTALPPKKSPTALNFEGGLGIRGNVEVQQPLELKELKADTSVDWAGRPLLKNSLVVKNMPRRLTVSGITDAAALLRLRKITPLADQLGMLGGAQIKAKWNAALPHSSSSVLTAILPPLRLLAANADVDAQIQFAEKPVKPLFDNNYLQIRGPLLAKAAIALNRGNVNLDLTYDLPHAGVAALAVADGLKGTVKVKTKIDLSDGAAVDLNALVGNLSPAKSFGIPDEVLPYLKDIDARLSVRSDIKSRVDLKQGEVVTGGDKLKVSLKGGTDLKVTNSRFEGQLAVKPPKVFRYGIRAQDKVTLDGVVRAGWELTQKDQKSLRLRGHAVLDNFSAQHQLGGLRNASGQIPFQQDLELPNLKSLKWSYLIQDNPFKRVDASKFVPLLSEDSMLVVSELNALEKKFGPLRGRFSLKQNMLTVDRLDADLFEGVLAGQGFVDIQPSRLTAGLQGRVTKLNAALLSAKPEKAGNAPLSARLAMVVDLSKALIEGRVDVTEIGKNQLLAMIDVLDPSGGDAMLNKARLALSAGYPTYVGMQMQQGFLNLDVGLGGLITQRFAVSNLPLTPIVNAKTQDLVKTVREVPIQ
jgi:hypothetical protein